MLDWSAYLTSICDRYAQWWRVYTLTDVVGQRSTIEPQTPHTQASDLLLNFDLGLMVETIEPKQLDSKQPDSEQEESKQEESKRPKTERLDVLEGLRKYAPEHVLLVGRPGSGKSTALARLLLEEAQNAQVPLFKGDAAGRGIRDSESNSLAEHPYSDSQSDRSPLNPPLKKGETDPLKLLLKKGDLFQVPILVELRYYQTSVLDLIRDFLKRYGLLLDRPDIETLLFQGQVLLLVDGLNELPSAEARRDVKAFRQGYPNTPMIFTTRDLGVGGDLDIAKRLEMQPLTEPQMRQFVKAYLHDQGDAMLRQLGNRLREFGQTPLLLWMLCSLFRSAGQMPNNLGLVFRQFTESYDGKLKQDIPVSDEFRRWCPRLLQQLAWVMTEGDKPTEIWVAIPKAQAEAILTQFLQDKVVHPENCALAWLTDLLNHHLIQLGVNDQIEFRHQLIQEYYAAECLLQRISTLSDDSLKRDYLNYLKWTEPIALMLGLVANEQMALRVVRLALTVDLQLGARLAGNVKPQFQQGAIDLLNQQPLPQFLQLKIWGRTRSDKVIPGLLKALEHPGFDVRRSAADVLGNLRSEGAIPGLLKALEHLDFDVRRSAADVLGKLQSEGAIPGLLKALKHPDSYLRRSAADALGQLQSEAAIPGLLQALEHPDFDVRWKAAEALGKLQSEGAIPGLLKALEHPDSYLRRRAADALGKLQSEGAIPGLLQALQDPDFDVRRSAADALGKLQSEGAIPGLLQALEDQHFDVRRSAADALGKLQSEAVIAGLLQALEHQNFDVRGRAADALGKLQSEGAIPGLLKALEDQHFDVRRRAAKALGQLQSEAVIPALLKALEDSNSDVRWRAAEALGQLRSETAIPGLFKALEDPDYRARRSAVTALRQLGSEAAIPRLLKALEDPYSAVRESAAEALGQIQSEAAIPALLQTLEDPSTDVRGSAVEALEKLRSEAAVPGLLNALEHPNFVTRRSAAQALGNLQSEAAIPGLLKALEDPNSGVRRSAADALEKLSNSGVIKSLNQLVVEGDRPSLLSTITAIQERCQFYNYTLVNPMSDRNSVFISYSHQDKAWLTRLQTMLKPLIRGGAISVWDDTRIKVGSKWRQDIETALASAKVAVFLVSPDFLNSDFIHENELPPLLDAAEQQGLTVVWVLLSYCLYETSKIVDYQAAHDVAHPLDSLSASEQNKTLAEICRKIQQAVLGE